MRVETYIPGLSKNTVDIVKHAEALGYDALVSGELNNEPFLPVLMGPKHIADNSIKSCSGNLRAQFKGQCAQILISYSQ